MASGQHNTQLRDWAVQHWKEPGHTVHAPEFQVSSSPSPQIGYCHDRSAGKQPLRQLRNCVFCCTRLRSVQSVCGKDTDTLEHSTQETCFPSTQEDRRGEDESLTVRTCRNFTKESWILTLQLFSKQLISNGFLSNDCWPSWESRWFPDETS